jgi:hypothetical protein
MEAQGERMYSSCSFTTIALYGGKWSSSCPGRALPTVAVVQETGWAPEPVWTQRLDKKSLVSVGDRNPVVHFVDRHYTD